MTRRTELQQRQDARQRLQDAGYTYADVKAWALVAGWTAEEIAVLNPAAVNAYLASTDAPTVGAAELEEPGDAPTGSRFDALFADLEFWRELAAQADTYGPAAPAGWQPALAKLSSGAHDLVRLVTGDGTGG